MALTTYLVAKAHGVRVHRDPGLPGPRLPPRRDRPSPRPARAAAQGPGRPARRGQPRLHGHHRRLGPRDPARGVRPRPRLGDLGALRRRARRGVPCRRPTWCPIGPARTLASCWPAASSPPPSAPRRPARRWPAHPRPGGGRLRGARRARPLPDQPPGRRPRRPAGRAPRPGRRAVRRVRRVQAPVRRAAATRCPSRPRSTGCTAGSGRSPAPTRCRTGWSPTGRCWRSWPGPRSTSTSSTAAPDLDAMFAPGTRDLVG